MKAHDLLKKLVDRPIAFNRSYVDITGSITSALMLSQAVYWTIRTDDGWFWKTQEEWTEETGMTRYEQETARKKLRDCEFWQEEKRGIPSKLWYRVDIDILVSVLSANKDAEIPHTVMLDSNKQESGNPASYYTETTPETISETTEEKASPPADVYVSHIPSRYTRQERTAEQAHAASQHGLNAKDFRELVDAWLMATGNYELANAEGPEADKALNNAKNTAVTGLGLGIMTPADVQKRAKAFAADHPDWSPHYGQLLKQSPIAKKDAGKRVIIAKVAA